MSVCLWYLLFFQSDAMLVKSGQNLMRIILKMMSEAEAVCVKVSYSAL